VTLTLSISPPVKAQVMWGSKQLARVAPDKPTVELQRPRNTGPLDLDIRAEGFLPHHTRLYSDRNDKDKCASGASGRRNWSPGLPQFSRGRGGQGQEQVASRPGEERRV
jgi:hypothetical protein